MAVKTLRKIIRIDEAKCNGCGVCIPACVEGALKIIDGKARLVSETYCDGLGACLGKCPQGAITIEEREVPEFSQAAVEEYQREVEISQKPACSCPSLAFGQFERPETGDVTPEETGPAPSMLGHWPVQLALVPPEAPFLSRADLVLAADCVPFAYAGFHRDYLKDHALLVACPKLDNFPAHLEKLAAILRQSRPRSLTVIHMEVPCCSGLTLMARQALELSGSDIPFNDITIGIRGDVK